MLKRERQQAYFNELWASMHTHLHHFFETRLPETLHGLRVDIKKIRALIVLLQADNRHKHFNRHLAAIKSLFRHAGEIRSAHVNLQLIEKYRLDDKAFEREQNTIIIDTSQHFCAKELEYVERMKKAYSFFLSSFYHIPDKYILRTYARQIKKTDRFFSKGKIYGEEVHEHRKALKILLYSYKILPKSLRHRVGIRAAYIDQLQEAIGQWHDAVLVVELLENRPNRDKKIIRQLKEQVATMRLAIRQLSKHFKRKVYAVDDAV